MSSCVPNSLLATVTEKNTSISSLSRLTPLHHTFEQLSLELVVLSSPWVDSSTGDVRPIVPDWSILAASFFDTVRLSCVTSV